MKEVISALIFISFFLNVNGQSSIKEFIDSLGYKYINKHKNIALIIGVNNRGIEQIYTFGETEIGSKIRPDTTNLFEIGQITQVFTSIIYADMTINGEIHADDPVQKFLPVNVPSPVYEKIICEPVQTEFPTQKNADDYSKNIYTKYACKPDPNSKPQPILLCYLSTHTSGLPDKPLNLKSNQKNPYADYSKENLYDFLKSYSLSSPIGYDFHYSDLGTALLGHILELKTNKSYENLVFERICSKLNMNNTKINLATGQVILLNGHTKKGSIAEHWTFNVLAPCGALHSDITDMMKFLNANISSKDSPLKNVLDYTHNPRINFHDRKKGDSSVALGWLVSPLGKENINYVWQSGLTGGFASFIGFVETTKTGVVILSNESSAVSDIGKEILLKLN